jgi:hypothetical protein
MRQPIDTAPRDGTDIWVEDAAGAIDIAHWSSQAGRWVWKNEFPINIAPTHWHPITEEALQEEEQSGSRFRIGLIGRRLAGGLIAVILVAAALVAGYDQFGEREVSERTEALRAAGPNPKPEAAGWQTLLLRERTAASGQEADPSRQLLLASTDQRGQGLEATPPPDALAAELVPATSAELQQSLRQERERSAALTAELTKVRGDLDSMLALSSKFQDDAMQRWETAEITAEELRQSLQQEQTRTAALTNELAGTRSEIEARDAQSRKAGDADAQKKQATGREIAELRQSLQQEREKTAALTQEVGAARQATTASSEQQRRALEEAQARAAALASELAGKSREIETGAAQSKKAFEEAVQQKQTAEAAIAELRQSLQQERDKTAALVKEAKTADAATADAEQQRRALEEAQARAAALTDELAGMRGEIETRSAQSRKAAEEAVQQKQTAEAAIAELRQSLQQERDKTAALVKEAKTADAATAGAEQQRRALEEAQARAAALTNELARMRGEIETWSAQSRKAFEEAAQQKQTAEAAIAEPRRSLQQEQEKTAALTKEAKATEAATAAAEQQRRALEEAQARAAALTNELAGTRSEMEARDIEWRKANDAAAQQRQAAEREIAELRQSLQQERSKAEAKADVLTEAMARELASARRPIDERVTVARATESPIVPVTQTVAAAVSQPPVTSELDKAEAARLIARAGALLGQGNIGAARIVLERAAESGNARASFMLAETYDPGVLSAWGTYGTRGEAAKARELYAKAHRGGVREAKERLDALPR